MLLPNAQPLTPEGFIALVDRAYTVSVAMLRRTGTHTETLLLLNHDGPAGIIANIRADNLTDNTDQVAEEARRCHAVAAIHVLHGTGTLHPVPPGHPLTSPFPAAQLPWPDGVATKEILTVCGTWPAADLRAGRIATVQRRPGRPLIVRDAAETSATEWNTAWLDAVLSTPSA